ncbi:MAG: hypothetical protein A2X31_07205 [Elusimicrobia bacterium GWB2_63_22]|nr:MAG: hypothetical protein A2X31_07205 [Elusimicrobia bacterium GWB2_63_22]
MPVRKKCWVPFRLRLLLALICAAGAGVYLTYSGIVRNAAPFISGEAGDRLFSRLSMSASLIESAVNSGIEKTRLTAARVGLRELLARTKEGALSQEDQSALLSRLQDAAGTSPSITAIDLMDSRGKAVAAIPPGNTGRNLSGTSDFRAGMEGVYVSAPRGGRAAMEYDITVPVRAPDSKPDQAPIGALRFRLTSTSLPWETADAGQIVVSLGRRQGNALKITGGAGGDREISLKSPEAAPFLPALEGKEGFTTLGTDEDKAIYAYRRLAAPDWVMTAGMPYAEASGRGAGMLKKARLNAALAFALLAITAFFIINVIIYPLTETARSAAVLLEDCGKPRPENDAKPQPELIDEALEAASERIRAGAYRGAELENETETLREEDADLKYQNAELAKLNKYLSERETKISELKREIAALKEKFGMGARE